MGMGQDREARREAAALRDRELSRGASEAAAWREREAARVELGKLGGDFPAGRTIEHAAASALVSIAFDLSRIAAVLELWQGFGQFGGE